MEHFREKFITEIEISDNDMDYPFYDNERNDERNEVIFNRNIWKNTDSVDIDTVIDILEKLKNKGSERLYIFAHSDHHSYIFTGVKYEKLKPMDRKTDPFGEEKWQ